MGKGTNLPRVLSIAGVVLASVFFATFQPVLGGQEVDLPAQSDPALRALIAQRNDLQMFGFGPFNSPVDQITSPDADTLRQLNEYASNGAGRLRAITDLLSVYDNLQCDADRTMLKPLLVDRLHLYSRLLELDADGAAIPLRIIRVQANTKRALKLRDSMIAAKNTLDSVATSLK